MLILNPKNFWKLASASFLSAIFFSEYAVAEMVVVNKRYVYDSSLLELHVYQNDGCRVTFDFRYKNRSSRMFLCEGEWNWDEVENVTTYFRDKLNIDKKVSFPEVMSKSTYQCVTAETGAGNC
ncbi:hypothetical protein [uncultured Roseibium sp.]|uniref:hypothetical protein n=1 Tax=uncultured Roseibium sp. TaxID=1936171 RepID=UPI0032180473